MKKAIAICTIAALIAATVAMGGSNLQPKSADAADYKYPSGKPAVAVVVYPLGEVPLVVDSTGVTDHPGSECSVLAPGAKPINGVRDIAVNSVGTAINKADPGLPADWL